MKTSPGQIRTAIAPFAACLLAAVVTVNGLFTSSAGAKGTPLSSKAPATDNATRADVERMLGTWRLVDHEPSQKQATRTRAEYIAEGLLLVGTAKRVLIDNLSSVPEADEVKITRNVVKVGRTEYRYSPGRGKLVVHRRGDRIEKQFRSVYDKIGPTELEYRFEKDGTLVLETNKLKELGGKTIRYTLSRSPAPIAEAGSEAPDDQGPMPRGIRTWTSAQGSTLEAELLSIANSNVVLKEKSGRVRTVLIRALSTEDQIYIKSIARENAGL